MAKMTAKGKTGMKISWNKINGSAGYDVFFEKAGKKVKKANSIKGNKTFKWSKSGLKKSKEYEAYVKAYVMKDGKKKYVKESPILHAYTGKGTKKFTNAKAVKVKFKKLKKKTQTIKRANAITLTSPQGNVTYKKISVTYKKAKSVKMSKKALKKYNKKAAKKIAINAKTDKITIKKGLKKGIYNVKVQVRAAGNAGYNASDWKPVTFKITVR